MESPEKDYQVRLDEAVERYSDMVYRISLTITKNEEDARDVFQETFLRLVKNQHKITSEEHLKAWLIKAASNCAKTVVTSMWNRMTQGMQEELRNKEEEQWRDNTLFLEMKKLPSKYSLVLYLYYYEEYSIREISELLEKNENSVKTHLARGRKLLRKRLERGGYGYESF